MIVGMYDCDICMNVLGGHLPGGYYSIFSLRAEFLLLFFLVLFEKCTVRAVHISGDEAYMTTCSCYCYLPSLTCHDRTGLPMSSHSRSMPVNSLLLKMLTKRTQLRF